LVPLAKRPLPQHKRKDLFVKMLREKGRFTPYLLLALRKSVRNLFGKGKKVIRRSSHESERSQG
jgi:hypothetical protein